MTEEWGSKELGKYQKNLKISKNYGLVFSFPPKRKIFSIARNL